jgi:hypothetical protein
MIEQNPNQEWQPPPLPESGLRTEAAVPKMSLMETLTGVFFEPGRTFENLRQHPRFLVAGLIIILSMSAFQIFFIEKAGYANIIKAQLQNNPQVEQMDAEQKQKMFEMYENPVMKYITYGSTPIVFVIIFVIGALIYWGAINAFGGNAGFLSSLSGWVYSSLPPMLLMSIANIIILLIKPIEDIDLAHSQGGLVQANLGLLVNPKDNRFLYGFLSAFDLFAIFGMILGAIALQKIGKLSSASAWTITIILFLIGMTFRIVQALFS